METTVITMNLIDVSAKGDSTPAAGSQPFAPASALTGEIAAVPSYATLEEDFFRLDGSVELFPDSTDGLSFGWWSDGMSGADGSFAVPPVLTVSFGGQHTCAGLTFDFLEDYPDSLKIAWYSLSGAKIAEKQFAPDGLSYFCRFPAENFGKVVVTFLHTSKPYRYVKVKRILYGAVMEFREDTVIEASIREEVNPVSAELSVNTLDLTLHGQNGEFDLMNPDGIYRMFQQRQPLSVRYETGAKTIPMGTFYLDSWENDGANGIFSAMDPLGILDKTEFTDGRIYSGEAASAIIGEIMASAGWTDYELTEELKSVPLTGWIPICTHREALQQAAIALNAIVDCSRGNTVRIYRQVQSYGHLIDRGRKFSGKTSLVSYVSGVELTVHSYRAASQTSEIFRGTLDVGDHEIRFPDAASGLSVTGATLVAGKANYAVVRVSTAGEVVLTGTAYEDAPVIRRTGSQNLAAGEYANLVKVEDATLISESNADETAKWLYAYYRMRYRTEAEIILDGERAGEQVAVQHRDGKAYTVNTIEGMTIDLTGGFTAQTEMIGDGTDVILSRYAGEFYAGESTGVM